MTVRRTIVTAMSCAGVALLGAFAACDAEIVMPPEPPPDPLACETPEPILQADTSLESGFVTCDDGFIHRESAVACADPQPEDSCTFEEGDCRTGADCTARPFGACVNGLIYEQQCRCRYGCETDADCTDGNVCACPGVGTSQARCVAASCNTSDECDGLCGLKVQFGACGEDFSRMACLERGAACRSDADCAGEDLVYCQQPAGEVSQSCNLGYEGEWFCSEPFPCGYCG